jgi:Family of unknown function (DUF6521)
VISLAELSREERALYNPGFMAVVVSRAVQGYQARYSRPCPVAVATLAAVMALQTFIRRQLPKTTGTGLARWLEENKAIRVMMAQNTTALAAVARLGLLEALQTDVLRCDENGQLHLRPRRLTQSITGNTEEIRAIQRASHMLGRWLPSTGSLSTVMTLLGVRP